MDSVRARCLAWGRAGDWRACGYHNACTSRGPGRETAGRRQIGPCGARLLDLAWPGQSCGLGSSLSYLLGRLPAHALSARLSDGAGRLRPRRQLGVRCI